MLAFQKAKSAGVTCTPQRTPHGTSGEIMIILGLILTVVGVLVGIPVLYIIGIILLVAGVLLVLFGATGRAIGGRWHYF